MDELEVWFESQQVDRISHCGEEVLRQQTVQRDSESIQILQCYCLCWLRSTGVLLLCFCHWVWPTETWCCCCKTIGFLCLLQPPVSDGGETKQTEVSSVVFFCCVGSFYFLFIFLSSPANDPRTELFIPSVCPYRWGGVCTRTAWLGRVKSESILLHWYSTHSLLNEANVLRCLCTGLYRVLSPFPPSSAEDGVNRTERKKMICFFSTLSPEMISLAVLHSTRLWLPDS